MESTNEKKSKRIRGWLILYATYIIVVGILSLGTIFFTASHFYVETLRLIMGNIYGKDIVTFIGIALLTLFYLFGAIMCFLILFNLFLARPVFITLSYVYFFVSVLVSIITSILLYFLSFLYHNTPINFHFSSIVFNYVFATVWTLYLKMSRQVKGFVQPTV